MLCNFVRLMSTIKCFSVVALAVVLIFGNSFPNTLGISSFENKARLHYASPAKLDNTFSNGSNKVVMINFDDGPKSQLIYAKPILDKYGFKASFFIICGRVGTGPSSMNWQDIAELAKDGMDIESHSMTHTNLNKLSIKALKYEIGGSKQCFANHGYNTTIFGYPFNLGSDKPSIVNLVAKYYDFGRSGSDRLMFLNCKGYMKDTQTDCRIYSANGKLTHANRYDIEPLASITSVRNTISPLQKCFVYFFR